MAAHFKEDLLHYIWKLKKFQLDQLKTTDGQDLELIDFGFHNHNSGPDFLNAKIKIDNTTWYGNVEIHINSSDWDKHKHQNDLAYNNVILHVVYIDDKTVYDSSNRKLITLELKGRIPSYLIKNYQNLLLNKEWIPCQNHISSVNSNELNLFIGKLAIERVETKIEYIKSLYKRNENNWEELFFQLLMIHFGFKKNNAAFERLSQLVSLRTLNKHVDQLFQIEAILFGQAGLLNDSDIYAQLLSKEFDFLKRKYKLKTMEAHEWQFFRLRPANFPTLRIAQLAMIISKCQNLFAHIREIDELEELRKVFNLRLKPYWQRHYRFGKTTNASILRIGPSSIDSIFINVLSPMLFFYGKLKKNDSYIERSLSLQRQLKSEKNSIIDKWKALGIEPQNAFESQALIQLKKNYCEKSKCLNCQIGHRIMSHS